jgi:F-type H+-transporting ATPase subunit epsilon
MQLTLVTPHRKILENAKVEKLFVPAFRGELEILEGHAELVTTLSAGVLKYQLAGQSEVKKVAVSWGYCQVSHGEITVMAETAEPGSEVNLKRAEESREEALKNLAVTDFINFEKHSRKFERAEARINASKN